MIHDEAILQAAFHRLRELTRMYDDAIPWSAIAEGFTVAGERVLFANRARGIFKPAQMNVGALSIKTVIPKKGRMSIYTDYQKDDEAYRYNLVKGNPYRGSNQLIWQSQQRNQPLIYFYGVAPGLYTALWPCYIGQIDTSNPEQGSCDVYVGQSLEFSKVEAAGQYSLPTPPERRYAIRETRARLHQASFREVVLHAYHHRCAMTGLPIRGLLEAAHIIPDAEQAGVPTVNNGLALSTLHHRAYDKNLIGIDPDYCLHVAESVLESQDGPLLERGIKDLHGQLIRLPRSREHHPDQNLLEQRFEVFQRDNG